MGRNFALTVTDIDGEVQGYRVVARSAYAVTRKAGVIARRYGHKLADAVSVEVHELTAGADMLNAVTLTPE
jgi:hypothetical protein